MSSCSGPSQTAHLVSMFDPSNEGNDAYQIADGFDPDPTQAPVTPGVPSLKRHLSQELENSRQLKIPHIEAIAHPTAHEIVQRLQEGQEQWGTVWDMTIQEHERNFRLVDSARAYLLLKQLDDSAVADEALYHSFLDMFQDVIRYKHFLDYRGEHAQVLIDVMQTLLDDGVVEQWFRNIFILALAALAMHSKLYPKCFILDNVTYQESEIVKDTKFHSQIVKGFMGEKAVHIKFTKRSLWDSRWESDWVQRIMLWPRLPHENVLPFYGLCPTNKEDHFPGIVTPWLEGAESFLKRNPDVCRLSLISGIAKGMAYLHSNGLMCESSFPDLGRIVFNNHQACLTITPLRVDAFDPTLRTLGSADDKDGFLEIHHKLNLLGDDELLISQEVDVYGFSRTASQILTANQPSLSLFCDAPEEDFAMLGPHKDMPIGHLEEGLDEHIWQLLQDCRTEDSNAHLTAQKIVERLDWARGQWEMALVIQRHETDFIVSSASAYMSLKQSGHGTEVADQASKLYQSFLNVFQDLTKYRHFLSCRKDHAQVLLDTMQALLDDGVIEQQFQSIFILAFAALGLHSRLYPKRFILDNVTYQKSEVKNVDSSGITEGLMEGQVVDIQFNAQTRWSLDWKELEGWRETAHHWFINIMLWAQLHHKNVFPFYGLCLINDENYFPGIVTPSRAKSINVEDFLESNPDTAIRQSFISDIAAGMAYLHSNGLAHGQIEMEKIFVFTDTTPPHACLVKGAHFTIGITDPTSEMLWPGTVNDKDNFLDIHRQLSLFDDDSQQGDVDGFSIASFQILTGNKDIGYFYRSIEEGEHPIEYVHTGLDSYMWQLLLDCQNLYTPLTACQIMHRLDLRKEEKQREIRLTEQKEKMTSLLSITFSNKVYYKSFLSCDGHDAQKLLDTFQFLLDNEEILDRNQLVAAMRRLSTEKNLFPHCFFFHGPKPAATTVPAASGGLADIYKIDFHGKETCFKVPVRVHINSKDGKKIAKAYAKEAIVWAQLSHPNILPFYGLAELRSWLSFVTRWAVNGHLGQYLARNPDVNRVLLCMDTAAGVEYLHRNSIVHGDLKGRNVLIDSSGRALLCDFGVASVIDPAIIKWTSQSTIASKGGTARWQAPELHVTEDEADKVYNTKESDVSAWASVCYEIFTGHYPFFEVSNPMTVVYKIMRGDTPTRPGDDDPAWREHGLNSRIWELMEECWRFEPSERPDITQVVLKLSAENAVDLRPPAEWESNDSMRFRNRQDANLFDTSSIAFWEDLESLLVRVIPGIQDASRG